MKRHDTDVISLVAGVLFAMLGVVFALDAAGTVNLDLTVVPAIVFIAIGLAISASVVVSARAGRPEPSLVEAYPQTDESPPSED
jgi:hypothetical protein